MSAPPEDAAVLRDLTTMLTRMLDRYELAAADRESLIENLRATIHSVLADELIYFPLKEKGTTRT